VDFDRRFIYLEAGTTKNGEARKFPIIAELAAHLSTESREPATMSPGEIERIAAHAAS
jgi:hypothetical protein